jgi:ATP-dependent helicase/nuclease subunit A
MVVDARTLPALARAHDGFDAAALVPAEGGDAVGARWQQRRATLLTDASRRPLPPVPVLQAAARLAPPAVAAAAPAGDTAGVLLDPGARGRGFGSLVHRILEWIPLEECTPQAVSAMATALAPSLGLGPDAAARAAETASRVLALPLLDRARAARRVFRELVVWFPEGGELLEGVVDLVFEEDGGLVVVDYKTDHIAPDQAIEQAAHHAPQLQLYGRGLAQATGMKVAERLVLFTSLGRAIPV